MISFGSSKDSQSTEKSCGTLRRAQLVTSFGPGSVVDLPGLSGIVGCIDDWKKYSCREVEDRNLERILGVQCFREPAPRYEGDDRPIVPVHRFPQWHYCPKCKRLAPFKKLSNEHGKCIFCNDNSDLIPSRFMAACENGHLEDFPYRWWVHHGGKCPKDSRNPLTIAFSNDTNGIEGIKITCECGAHRTMAGSTNSDALSGYKCHGKRPWVGSSNDAEDPLHCGCKMQTIQRASSNSYYPMTISALTIPPTTSSVIEHYWKQLDAAYSKYHDDEETLRDFVKAILIAEPEADIDEAIYELKSRKRGAGVIEQSIRDLHESEFHALSGENKDDRRFKTEHVDAPLLFADLIEDVVLVKRLREVLVQYGFRRIYPEPKGTSREYMPLSKGGADWLPGVELLGEGIFVRLNQEKLAKWEAAFGERYRQMETRLSESHVRCDNFSPTFVLLHSLSHALIRQMASSCGYSSSSLKERIFSTYPGSSYTMSGILIYTSSSDSDGSLGGLVRQGRPENLSTVISEALRELTWCSSDPLCIQETAQGYDYLNYAACHSCMLLPETSCSNGNCLLDRAALIGLPDNPTLGFFNEKIWMDVDAGDKTQEKANPPLELVAVDSGGDYRGMSFTRACRSAVREESDDAFKRFAESVGSLGDDSLENPDCDVEMTANGAEELYATLAWRNARVMILDEEDAQYFDEAFGDGWQDKVDWKVFDPSSADANDVITALRSK